jgi:hypothetical protein
MLRFNPTTKLNMDAAPEHRRARSITSLLAAAGNDNDNRGPTVLNVLVSAWQVRWRTVEERLSTHPHETKILDTGGCSVLYRALARRHDDYPPVRIVRKLIDIYPHAVWERYNGGAVTLLEVACRSRASLETLEVLTQARPSIPEDATALSAMWKICCESHGDEETFLQFLKSGSAEAFLVGCKFQLLLRYITTEMMLPCTVETALSSSHCSLELFEILCSMWGSSVCDEMAMSAPLSYEHALNDNPDLFSAKLKHLASKELSKCMRCDFSKLQITLDQGFAVDDIIRLLPKTRGNASCDILGVTNNEPIWIAPAFEQLLKKLDNNMHSQLSKMLRNSAKDPNWNQMIGAATAIQCPHKLMDLLITLHPEMLQQADRNGWLPLHHAIVNQRGDDIAIVSKLTDAYPAACHHRDNRGHLPFHLACCTGKGVKLLEKLLEYNPHAMEKVDGTFQLPPAFLAAQSGRASLSSIFHLLTRKPDIIAPQES